jgi:hypothetical protein
MNESFAPRVGAVFSADIAVPEHDLRMKEGRSSRRWRGREASTCMWRFRIRWVPAWR